MTEGTPHPPGLIKDLDDGRMATLEAAQPTVPAAGTPFAIPDAAGSVLRVKAAEGRHVAQYDTIALVYQRISAAVPLRDAEWYSLHQRLGDLTGLSVLDLACGDGMGTRLLKRWGAARVVGVDISAQMIALARQREDAEPLGIEYRVGGGARRFPAAAPSAAERRRRESLSMAKPACGS
jgi:SAM-dependent methyltransferase